NDSAWIYDRLKLRRAIYGFAVFSQCDGEEIRSRPVFESFTADGFRCWSDPAQYVTSGRRCVQLSRSHRTSPGNGRTLERVMNPTQIRPARYTTVNFRSGPVLRLHRLVCMRLLRVCDALPVMAAQFSANSQRRVVPLQKDSGVGSMSHPNGPRT